MSEHIAGRWVRVTDALPEAWQWVLTYHVVYGVDLGYCRNGLWYTDELSERQVTAPQWWAEVVTPPDIHPEPPR